MSDFSCNGDVPMPDPATTQAPPPERKVRLARLSGKATAGWLVVFLLLIGVLIPAVVKLPFWLDFEIVLAVWWLVWLAGLGRPLYTGQRVTGGHQLGEPRNWFSTGKEEPTKTDPLDSPKKEPKPTSK